MKRPILIPVAFGVATLAVVSVSIGMDRLNGDTYRAIDGDTFEVLRTGERIRISNIDTPEIKGPCPQLARRAAEHLRSMLSAGGVTISRQGVDRYGRTLAAVAVDGKDVGDYLVSIGVARRWAGERTECYR